MSSGFLKFLQQSARRGDAIAIESRPSSEAAPSLASEWAQPVDPPPRSLARDLGVGLRVTWELGKIASAGFLLAKLALLALEWAPYAVLPAADRALRPSVYGPAEEIARQTRLAGFSGGAYVFGSPRLSEVKSDYDHQKNPAEEPSDGGTSSASLARRNVSLPLMGSFNSLPNACHIRMGADDTAVLSNPKASRQFSAIHELSHCDEMQGSWARFAPSEATLNPDQARAFRLILLAESQLPADERESLHGALTDAAHLSEPTERKRWRGLAINLFDESIADSRALLILSRLRPQTWRADGWEAWLQRAAGESGATQLTAHSHATEESISMILSTSNAQLAQLSPDGLNQLAAASASDGVVIKLSKQGWHQRFSPELAPGALAIALQRISKIPPDHILWRAGSLPTLAGSRERLQADRDWLASGAGARALQSLLSRMGEIHGNAQRPVRAQRRIEGRSIDFEISPSAGSFDLRYEGIAPRSAPASLVASAALYQRALKEGGPQGFKTPSSGIWPYMDRYIAGSHAPLMRHMASAEFLREFGDKPVHIGHNPRRGLLSYRVGGSLEEVTETERPSPPQLNLLNQREASSKPDDDAKPSARGPKL